MILSCYMHDSPWTGLGCEPITISHKFHKLGIITTLAFVTLCNNSSQVMAARRVALTEFMNDFKSIPPNKREPIEDMDNFHIDLQNIKAYDKLPKKKAEQFLNTRIESAHCFLSENTKSSTTVKNVLGTILANEQVWEDDDGAFCFSSKGVEFAVDNCATHNVCNDKRLFIGEIKEIKSLAINGVGGSTSPVGIGTVAFKIRDSTNKEHYVELKNTI